MTETTTPTPLTDAELTLMERGRNDMFAASQRDYRVAAYHAAAEILALRAQRDDLLAALKGMQVLAATYTCPFGVGFDIEGVMACECNYHAATAEARAAIARAEGRSER